MKKIFFICTATLVLIAVSCGNKDAKIIKLQARIDSLEAVIVGYDDPTKEYIGELNTIYYNLDMIKKNQGIIKDNNTSNEDELTGDKRAIIQESITLISQLMYDNSLIIDNLRKKLKNAPLKDPQLEGWLTSLNQEMVVKAEEIGALNEQLSNINIRADILTHVTDSLNAVNSNNYNKIKNQDVELNTVYYCKGTFKELTTNKILYKGKLSADVNINYLTKADKRKVKEIPIGAKKAILKTLHPNGSYTLVTENKKVTKLVINNAAKFWSISKYCVLMLE